MMALKRESCEEEEEEAEISKRREKGFIIIK